MFGTSKQPAKGNRYADGVHKDEGNRKRYVRRMLRRAAFNTQISLKPMLFRTIVFQRRLANFDLIAKERLKELDGGTWEHKVEKQKAVTSI